MKLYSANLSPYAARVRLSIYRKELDIEILLPPNGLKSEEYLALNPMGQVPSLELDTGVVIPDSAVILEYLEDAFPNPSLRPDNIENLARARLFLRIPDLHFQNAPRILIGMRKPEDRKQEIVSAALANLERGLDYLNYFLDEQAGPWAVGGRPSIADCAIVPVLNAVSVIARLYERPDLLESRNKLDHYWAEAHTDPINARVIGEQLAALRQQSMPPTAN